jgi:integrase/recombinase XerD
MSSLWSIIDIQGAGPTSGQPSSYGLSLTTGRQRMPRQYAREPLSSDEGNRLIQACDTLRERQVILILLDTGLRVSELAQLTKQNILWQERQLAIHGKGGPYGKRSKRRVLPMTDSVRLLIEHHYTMQDSLGITARQIEQSVKRVANRAGIAKPVTPHVLRHTFSVSCLQCGITPGPCNIS